MAGGIVTTNFEELKDSMVHVNHITMIQDKIRASLTSVGKEYTGQELDGMLYPSHERVIIATHKGPMQAKFEVAKPKMEIRHEIKKVKGSGKSSLAGKQTVKMDWFKGTNKVFIDPVESRRGQESVGWTDKGIDFSKSGSIYGSLIEWLPQVGLVDVDSISMGGLLDALSGKENHTMMFVKGVLILRTISLGYSVEGARLRVAKELPGYIAGDKREKVGQIGGSECIIDLDKLSEKEVLAAMLSSMEYPSVQCAHSGTLCVYSRISAPKCDVTFVGREGLKINRTIPTPKHWWKALLGLASKLGAIEDLITALRITRGLGSWTEGMEILDVEEMYMTMDIPPTRGCRSVLIDSNLAKMDKIDKPTNMACSLGELICDWGA